jgi:chemotaxis protein MotB
MSHGGDDGLHEEHEEHVNHEAWVIPYADLLTLLMAMFIALFAMSTVDIDKFKELAIGFNEALGGGKLDSGIGGSVKDSSPAFGNGAGTGPFQGGELTPGDNPASSAEIAQVLAGLAQQSARKGEQARETATLKDVEEAIKSAAKSLGFGNRVRTAVQNDGLRVTLLTDQVLFDSGQAVIKAEGLALLAQIGPLLIDLPNAIEIRGHTDSVPYNGQFIDNRGLSQARAAAVVRLFERLGLASKRLEPVGMADNYPIGDNRTAAGRAENRRVEIIVQSNLVEQTLKEFGLDGKLATTTPTTKPIARPVTPGITVPAAPTGPAGPEQGEASGGQ